ncbi:MAG: MATE family efflux transporter [Spirochaetota bacterium]
MFSNVKQILFTDKSFYQQLAAISGPIMLHSLLTSSLSFIDTLMIGQLGGVAIAAVGLANQLFFLMMLYYFGVSSGSSVFIAQFWGIKDTTSIHKTMGICLSFSLLGALLFSTVSLTVPHVAMRVFSPDPEVIETGASYLRIVGISYLFSAVAMSFSAALRSTEKPKIPLFSILVSLSANIGLNYLLIFGNLGFPAMGVAGAALATTISRGLEIIIMLLITYRRKEAAAGSLRAFFSFNRIFVKRYLITALPVILNEIAWSLGMVTYKMVFARMGTSVIAAANVVESIQNLFFVVFAGTAHGSAVMIGKRIGQGKAVLAQVYANKFLLLSLLMGGVIGCIMFFAAPFVPNAFNVSDTIVLLASRSLMVIACLLPMKAFNMLTVVGILRSGGDTRASLLLEMSGVWFVGVPLAIFGGLYLGLPIYWLYLLINAEELYKMVIGIFRIKSGKWIHVLTETSHY